MVWLRGVLERVGMARALCSPRHPGMRAVRLRSRRGGSFHRVAPALQPFIQPEPRSVAFGLVKIVCTMAAGVYVGDEIGDYIKNILKSEFDFPEPYEPDADDDHSLGMLP